MIKKVVKIRNKNDLSLEKDDLYYWLSKTPEERVSAVEHLRKQHYGEMGRIKKVVRIYNMKHRRTIFCQ